MTSDPAPRSRRRPLNLASRMPFGVYVHIPFCAARCDYCDFATWTDRAHLIDDVRRRVRRRPRRAVGERVPARDERVLRRRHAVAHRRRRSWCASSTRSTGTATPRSPSSAIPTASTRPSSRRTAAAGVNRLSFGVQSMAPHVLAALGPNARSRERDACGRARPRRGLRAHQRRPHLRHARARPLDDWRATLAGALALGRRRTSSAYALTVEPATPLGQRVAAGARRARRRRTRPTAYLIADELPRRRRARVVRDVELGAARRGVPPQPPVLDRGRVPRDRLCRARPHRAAGAGGTCARPSATSPRSRAGASAPRPGPRRSTRRPRAEEAFALALRTRGGRAGRRRRPRRAVDELAAGGLRATGVGDRVVLTRARTAHGVRRDGPPAAASPGARWHSVTSSANGDAGRNASLTSWTERTHMHAELGRAQGRDPARDRRALRRQRAAGRVADRHADAPASASRPPPCATRCRCSNATASSRSRTRRRAGCRPTTATATTSTTSRARARCPRPSGGAIADFFTSCDDGDGRPAARDQPAARRGSPRTRRSSSVRRPESVTVRSAHLVLLQPRRVARGRRLSNGAVEKETVVLDDDADRRRRRRPRAPGSRRTSTVTGWPSVPTLSFPAAARRPRPTRSRRAIARCVRGTRRDASRRAALRRRREPARRRAGGVREHERLGSPRAARTARRARERCSASCSGPGSRCASARRTSVADLRECSLVLAPYLVEGEPLGTIGVLGPTRMDYRKAQAAVVDRVAPTRSAALSLIAMIR